MGRSLIILIAVIVPKHFACVIEGWQLALRQMHIGDRWIIYIPYTLGYGSRASGPIPAFSTLIFEVELLSIA